MAAAGLAKGAQALPAAAAKDSLSANPASGTSQMARPMSSSTTCASSIPIYCNLAGPAAGQAALPTHPSRKATLCATFLQRLPYLPVPQLHKRLFGKLQLACAPEGSCAHLQGGGICPRVNLTCNQAQLVPPAMAAQDGHSPLNLVSLQAQGVACPHQPWLFRVAALLC